MPSPIDPPMNTEKYKHRSPKRIVVQPDNFLAIARFPYLATFASGGGGGGTTLLAIGP